MKVSFVYFWTLLFLSYNLSGQAPVDVEYYLGNKEISSAAKEFYKGRFKAGDNDKTTSIIDSLRTTNKKTRPFYIYLVSKIMEKSDGALSESLGLACKEFIETNPDDLVAFLYSTNKIVHKKYIDKWAGVIASEFMISCEGEERKCVKESSKLSLVKTATGNKEKLLQLYKRIESHFR